MRNNKEEEEQTEESTKKETELCNVKTNIELEKRTVERKGGGNKKKRNEINV